MALTRPTLTTIYERMKADAEQRFENTNWVSRSLMLIILAVVAGAIYLCYGFLLRVAQQLFFTTADDDFVRQYGRLYNLPRKAAEFAEGTVTFTGVNGTPIPQYTEVQTTDGTIFETQALATIAAGVASVDIKAQESGVDGNVTATTMQLVTPIPDIDSECTVTSYIAGSSVINGTSGGADEETKAEHVTRLLQRTQNPPGSGNTDDYERWALEISGVGRAWCLDANDWLGAGTCGVIIATSNLDAVGASVKSEVESYIDSKRPVGAIVTVEDPVLVNVNYYISIYPNNAATQTAINTALTNLFLVTSEPGGTIKITDYEYAIKGTGVQDFEITGMYVGAVSYGGAVNVVMTGIQVARFGSVSYATLT